MKRYGKYQLLERLGAGGMAEVFLARVMGPMDVSRYVAIKRVLPNLSRDPALSEMFIDEARLVSRLAHPQIVGVQDFGLEDECYFLAMEYVEGHDVRQVLRWATLHSQPLPLECALYITAEVARGLDYAHALTNPEGQSLQIVHRDVSPANVLLSYGGDVKLTDFGVARTRRRLQTTHSGSLKGKFRYMAPEQARGEAFDHRADLFALGTVLYEMITHRGAFVAESETEALKMVQTGLDPSRFEELPEDVRPLVEKAMQPDPALRYARGNELAEAIELVLRRRNPTFGPPQLARYLCALFETERAERRERVRRYDAGEQTADDDDITHFDKQDEQATRSAGSVQKPVWRVAAGAAAAVVVIGAAIGVVVARSRAAPPPNPVAAVRPMGTLVVESEPAGAQVSLDGERLPGQTPIVRASVDARPHVLVLSHPGYRDAVVEVTVPAGDRRTVLRALEAEPRQLTVTSTPAGAAVTLDGAPSGTTPCALKLGVGKTYAVEVSKAGLQPWKKTLTVDAATPPLLDARLESAAPRGFGTLDLQSEPWADITVDGKASGQTPARGIRLAAGPHKVVLSNPGFPPKTFTVVIQPNQTLTRSTKLEP
jgi:serine/threonine-protein kinase